MDEIDLRLRSIDISQLQQETEMNDQNFLEMSNHCKELLEDKDREVIRIRRELHEDKIILYKSFGIINLINDMFVSMDDLDRVGSCIELNLEYLLTQLKEHLDIL